MQKVCDWCKSDSRIVGKSWCGVIRVCVASGCGHEWESVEGKIDHSWITDCMDKLKKIRVGFSKEKDAARWVIPYVGPQCRPNLPPKKWRIT